MVIAVGQKLFFHLFRLDLICLIDLNVLDSCHVRPLSELFLPALYHTAELNLHIIKNHPTILYISNFTIVMQCCCSVAAGLLTHLRKANTRVYTGDARLHMENKRL